MKNYSVGSMFAGVGGICHAFRGASCDVLWANELDPLACVTYRLNNTKTNLLEKDVKSLSSQELSNIDILVGGFPCQPFSQAGHGKGFNDERGTLFFEISRLLRELQPYAYLLENVRTLSTHDNGNTFEIIKQEMINAGYSFIPFILNASKYTDIPQGRERLYIVGFRGENNYAYDKPIQENFHNNFSNNCQLSRSFNIPKRLQKQPKEVKHFLDSSTVIPNDIYNNLKNHIHRKIIEAVKQNNIVYQYRYYYVRENKSNVCPTLTANMGGGGHNTPIILDGKYPRRLTPKECFNLQGFPVNFKLPETQARGQLYKQAGNSVVVPMVQKIAEEMVRVLNENN